MPSAPALQPRPATGFPQADAAISTSIGSDVDVVFGVGVAVNAKEFASVSPRNSEATSLICLRCDCFQVRRPDAWWIATQMVELQTITNRAMFSFKSPAVRPDVLSPIEKHTVAKRLLPSNPNPTALGFPNLGPEPLLWRNQFGGHASAPQMGRAISCLVYSKEK